MIPLLLVSFLACGDSTPQEKPSASKTESPKPTPKAEAPKPAPKAEAPKPAPKAEAPKVEAVASAGDADGQKVYTKVCQQCHQAAGTGIPTLYPPLAKSDWVKKDVDILARIVLHGLQGPIKVNGQDYNQAMTAQGNNLSDAEIASALTYVRSSWGNAESEITTDQVKGVREKYKDRTKQWTVAELEGK